MSAMTRDEIREFVRLNEAAWERRDTAALMEDYADNCEVVSPMLRTLRGKAAVEGSFRDLFRAFGEWTIAVDDVLVDLDGGVRCAIVTTIHAVHAGEIFGFPASGRRFELHVVRLLRFENNKIASDKRLYDFSGLLIQLGILKEICSNIPCRFLIGCIARGHSMKNSSPRRSYTMWARCLIETIPSEPP